MKHIKIFEAFESDKLSKTLGYIDSTRDKETFLDYIKRICNVIDFPYSKLSDEYFDYLPFSAALKKSDIITDEPCEATSGQVYPDYAVDGEVCTNGKIKRKWGRQTRNVVCPVCNGTGVKPKKGEPKLVKFWFNKDGKYINTTCVDGIVRNKKTSSIPLPQTPSSYTPSGDRITNSTGARRLQTGQYVHIKINGREMYAYIIAERRNGVFAIQETENGGSPTSVTRRQWQKIGRCSWQIDGGDFTWLEPVSLNNIDEDAAESEVDPYTWNTGVMFGYRGVNSNGRDIENSIKDAHFAIVMDFSKLKKSEFQTRTSTKSEREESKHGALAFKADHEIKRENIERYVNILSDRLKVDGTNVANLSNVIKRLLGYRNTVYNLRQGIITDSVSSILKGYIELLLADDDRKESKLNDLNDNIKYYYRNNMDRNKKTTNNIKDTKSRLEKEGKEEYLNILNLMDQLSLTIYEKIINFELETIEDLEILNQKILSMKNIIKVNRYSISKLSYFMDYLNRRSADYAYRYLTDRYYVRTESIPKIEEGIKTAMRIIKKL